MNPEKDCPLTDFTPVKVCKEGNDSRVDLVRHKHSGNKYILKVFDKEKGQQDWEHMLLILGLLSEMNKGRFSYWYPYIRQFPDIIFACFWDKKDIDMMQDSNMVVNLKQQEEDLKNIMDLFMWVLINNPDIFPQKYLNANLFLHLYFHVRTRAFGGGVEGLDSSSLVPMADNLNHAVVNVVFEMMNVPL